jgi:GAF domain-containing protein
LKTQVFAVVEVTARLIRKTHAATCVAVLFIHKRTVSSSPEIAALGSVQLVSRRQFFECLPVACYGCDCSGTITDYNSRSVELWGRAPQETDRFTGAHKVLDAHGGLVTPETTATAFLLRSGVHQLRKELVIERPDGKRVTVISNAAALLNEEGKVIGALDVLQDITDRRWSEDARRVAERVSASARIAMEVVRLKPALLSMVNLLDLLGQDATLSVSARGYAELARLELVHFDALLKHMAHLSGAA